MFKIAIQDAAGKETLVGQTNITQHEWRPFEADLSPWAGQTVRLKLMVDVGPKDNSAGDWAPWAELRVESIRPALIRELQMRPVASEKAKP